MLNEIKKRLRDTLSDKRYIHSLGVADEARRLAQDYGCDADKAYLAGLLHDCAKGIPTDKQLEKCDEMNVKLDKWTRMCPPVIHGFLGAEIAKSEYGIDDNEILGAIRRHTVGGENMTLLEKIIYIADMTEENRDFDGVSELRNAVNKDLDGAIELSIRQQIKLCMSRRSIIHPDIICLWNDILTGTQNKERRRGGKGTLNNE